MTDPRRALPILLPVLLVLALAGCGGGEGDGDADAGGESGATAAAETDSGFYSGGWDPVEADARSTADWADPDAFTHQEGRFRVYWPEHCFQFRTRTLGDAVSPRGLEMVHAMGKVKKDEECGVSVTVWFYDSDGSAFTPDDIMANMESLIRTRGWTISRRAEIERLGMKGVLFYMVDSARDLLIQTEVYLYKGRTLMVSAWDRGDYMFQDAELQRFFRSVEFID